MEVDKRVQGGILTVAVALGVIGNIPVIVSICRKRSLLENNHYYIILHLAICDLVCLLFFIPDIHSIFSAESSIASSSYLLCKTLWPAHTVVFTAGANFLVVISILRYRATVHPLEPAVRRRTLKITSTLVYVLAIICVIPYVVVLRFDEISGCNADWPKQSLGIAYTIFLSVVQYFLPVLFLSIIYLKIGKIILTRNSRLALMDARNQIKRQSTATLHHHFKIKSLKPLFVCFTLVMCFIVSGFPAQLMWIICVSASKELPSYFSLLYALYIFGTAVINPYVYGALDKKVFSLFQNCRKKMGKKKVKIKIRFSKQCKLADAYQVRNFELSADCNFLHLLLIYSIPFNFPLITGLYYVGWRK
jgi:hypothetical protein